jgi:hypothetical protein
MSLITILNASLYDTGGSILEPPTGNPPDLSNLHIQDALTKDNIPVGGRAGWSDDYIQTMAIHKAPLQYVSAGNFVDGDANVVTNSFWCHRTSSILISGYSTTNNCVVEFRLIYGDINAVLHATQSYTLSALDIETQNDAGDDVYLCESVDVDNFGANYVGMQIISVTNGDIEIFLAGV